MEALFIPHALTQGIVARSEFDLEPADALRNQNRTLIDQEELSGAILHHNLDLELDAFGVRFKFQ
ncbi:hypothetical protein DMX06_19795 [Pseudomonas mosselii]|nr:hypothetical protein DMX06_19795 [Pseudomonas mosselii]